MDERKQRSEFLSSTAVQKPGDAPRRPKQWLAHAGHAPVANSEKGPHWRVFQGPGR